MPSSSSLRLMAFVGLGALAISMNILTASMWTLNCSEEMSARYSVDQNIRSVPPPPERHERRRHNKEQTTKEKEKKDEEQKEINEYGGNKYGINPIYIELLKKAQENSEKRRQTSPKKLVQGIVIGPTEGRFDRYTFRAIQNARRIRNVLAMTNKTEIQVALMTSQEHHDILQLCGTVNIATATKEQKERLGITNTVDNVFLEACRLWDSGALFDDVIVTNLDGLEPNDNLTGLGQGSSAFWLKALGGYRNAPYKTSLFIDSDAYPCPGFENLFLLTSPIRQKIWQVPILRPADFAIGLEQFPLEPNDFQWNPGRGQGPNGRDVFREEYHAFALRNTGTVLFHFDRPLTLVFAEFLPLVAEHAYNHVATMRQKVPNDQTPFKIALFVFHKLFPDFVEQQIPMHASCRSFAGKPFAGTDGYQNGMFPLQSDGKHCSECYCTPCLIAHTSRSHKVRINGFMGWEEDFSPPAELQYNN